VKQETESGIRSICGYPAWFLLGCQLEAASLFFYFLCAKLIDLDEAARYRFLEQVGKRHIALVAESVDQLVKAMKLRL
jgi:hypothetical protein